jgi:hypothetical protein
MQQRRQKYEPTKEGAIQSSATSPLIIEEITSIKSFTEKRKIYLGK